MNTQLIRQLSYAYDRADSPADKLSLASLMVRQFPSSVCGRDFVSMDELRALLSGGQNGRVAAIKSYRARTETSLKDGIDIFNEIRTLAHHYNPDN